MNFGARREKNELEWIYNFVCRVSAHQRPKHERNVVGWNWRNHWIDFQCWTIVTKITFERKQKKQLVDHVLEENVNDIIIKVKMYYLRFISVCAERKRWLRTLQFNGANSRWWFNKCILSVSLCYTSHSNKNTPQPMKWLSICVEIAVFTQFYVRLH